MLRIVLSTTLLILVVLANGQSIFASGEWFKIGVTESGMYKLDREYFSSTLGLDINSFDPSTIKIYGKGGGPLPQANGIGRPSDPPENGILRQGLDDGVFNSEDYVLFYAEGPDKRTVAEGHFLYEDNIYSDTAYYFVTINGSAGKGVGSIDEVPPGNYPTVDKSFQLLVHEANNVNILKSGLSRGGSGREWYGELFAVNVATERVFDFEVPGFTGRGELILATFGQSEADSASMTAIVNGDEVGKQYLERISPLDRSAYTNRGIHHTDTFDLRGSASANAEIVVQFERAPSEGQSIARLDKLLLKAERTLSAFSNHLVIRPATVEIGPSTLLFTDIAEDTQLWDISDPQSPLAGTIDYSDNASSSDVTIGEESVFVAFVGSSFPTPTYFGRVSNQNLKALAPRDGVIITTGELASEAERLANFHRTFDNLGLEVVDVSQIYNEFSSGRQDITAIRDLIRYYYDRSGSFKYVLLFGDCSYDYKYRLANNTNLIPTYESRNSVHPISSYSSDDFFGFLEDHEGEWLEEDIGDHTLEVGVGRLPARSRAEAETIVDKIIRYATANDVLGDWKTKVTYVVDDGDRNTHMDHAEQLSSTFEENRKDVLAQKLYLDAVPQVVGASEESSPQFRSKLLQSISEGTFLINYIGHGNEFQWMDEDVLNDQDIEELTNRRRLPIFVAATCQFGRYDDPDFFSGSEQLLFHPNGGAIALLTTTRAVFASTNLPLNQAFHESIFELEDGNYPRIGDIVRSTKNESLRGTRNRNFSLLGDPFLRLDYPDFNASITNLNGKSIDTEIDTLSALEEIQITGEVQQLTGERVSDFEGYVQIVLLDNPTEVRTLGQENIPFRYDTQENELFRGEATVANGIFSASFILTRNISYRFENAKFILYAVDSEKGLDASGASTNIVLGGTSETVREDTSPPSITAFVNDDTFSNGNVVDPNSLLIAQIADETGINISTNGINQNITLRINGGEPFPINDFFTANRDASNSGTIIYPLTGLAPGKYSVSIKAWDLYNNSNTATVDFVVSDEVRVNLEAVKNFPNPATTETTFSFEHNRPGEELEVIIQFFNTEGALEKELVYLVDNGLDRVEDLSWRFAPSIRAGIYVYRIRVKSTLDGAEGSAIGRLIVN